MSEHPSPVNAATEPSDLQPEMSNRKRVIVSVALLPLSIILFGCLIFAGLRATKPTAPKKPKDALAHLVEVRTAAQGAKQATVRAQGSVVPAQQVILQPEVSGVVIWQNEDLVPGGVFEAGAPLLRVDARNYKVAVEQQAAQFDQAQMSLEMERGRQEVAEHEWKMMGKADGEDAALALRKPQIRAAQANLRAAQGRISKAKLDLRKTYMRAPFNAFVQSERVDVGQLVSPSSPLATLVGTDTFWVQVSVPIEQLSWIDIPKHNADEGSPVRVWQNTGNGAIERKGRVVRLLGDLDPVGRMARVLVEIDDPLGLNDEGNQLPLLLGAYVNVEIRGRMFDSVVEIPRGSLREGDMVYVMGKGNKLEIREVAVVWRAEDTVWLGSGLKPGDRYITSRLSSPVVGMKLRALAPAKETPDVAVPKPNTSDD